LRGATTTTTTTKKTLIYLDRSLELLSPSFPSLGSKKRFSSSFLVRLGWTFVVAVDASSLTISFPNTTKNETSSFLYIYVCFRASCVALLSGPSPLLLRYNRREKGAPRTRNNNNNNNPQQQRQHDERELFLAASSDFFFAKNSKIFSVSFLRYFVLNFTTA
jgi:hypothetical protein